MLGQILAAFDILAGIVLAGQLYWNWSPVVWLGVVMIAKACYSLATGIAAGFYFDFLGWMDLLAGILILTSWAIPYFFIVMLAKGIWSMVAVKI